MIYRHAYLYFIFLFIIALLGFTPTYFSIFSTAKWQHHFHGLTSTFWLLLLIGQSFTISKGLIRIHVLTGKLVYVAGPLFIIGSFLSLHTFLNSNNSIALQFAIPTSFSDGISTITFAGLLTMALRKRNNIELHARYMSATILLLIAPALSRFISFWVPGFIMTSLDQFVINVFIAQFITVFICLSLIFHDYRLRKPSVPFIIVLTVLILQIIGEELIGQGSLWTDIALNFKVFSYVQVILLSLPVSLMPLIFGNMLYRKKIINDITEH